MSKTPDREDVLYMFAIEDVRDRATFNKYVELYPQYKRDLLHLWRQLAIEDDKDKAAASRVDDPFERAVDELGDSCLNIKPPPEPQIKQNKKRQNVIVIDGKSYRITKRLGVTLGTRSCIVTDPDGNLHTAVKEPWRWWRLWTTADKLQPRGTLVGQSESVDG